MSNLPRTLIDALAGRVANHGDSPALRVKRDGAWQSITWSEYQAAVLRCGRALLSLGLDPGQGVGILGNNRPEWFITALGAVAAGGLPAGIYTSLTPDQCQYIAHHCEAAVVVVENQAQLAKLLEVRSELPRLKALVLMEGESPDPAVYSWAEFLDLADRVPTSDLEAPIRRLEPGDLCTLIYTSGTTGTPKAVMLSHHNVLWTAQAVIDQFEFRTTDQFVSYLPLSHIAEQMLSLHAPLLVGGCVSFAESIERLPDNLREIRPHIFFGVPRVWEKIQAGIEAVGATRGGLARAIGRWARAKGLAAGYADQAGTPPPPFTGIANRLVFSKVRQRLGLDRTRVCAVAAAPSSRVTLEFFLSLGIPIYEVYGLSESTGPATISSPRRYRTGAAGWEVPGTELRLADDGEVLTRGPHVFLGYYKDPVETALALDEDGWLHTGDIGEIDPDGFLSITDRKKELIVTAGGKNIAPQPIEGLLRAIPGIAQAVVIGDRQPFLSALLTLEPESFAKILEAAESRAADRAAACTCGRVLSHMNRAVEGVNAGLARYESIRKFTLLPETFSIEKGELTPTMKLKRRVIHERHAQAIAALYSG